MFEEILKCAIANVKKLLLQFSLRTSFPYPFLTLKTPKNQVVK